MEIDTYLEKQWSGKGKNNCNLQQFFFIILVALKDNAEELTVHCVVLTYIDVKIMTKTAYRIKREGMKE